MISGRPPTSTATPAPRTPSLRARRGRSSPAPTAAGTHRQPTATAPDPAARRRTRRAASPSAATRRSMSARTGPSPISTNRARMRSRIRRKTSIASVDPLDRPEVRDVDDERLACSGGHSRARSAGSNRRRYSPQSRKFGMTRIACRTPSAAMVSALQALGHGGDAVRPLDREGDHPGVRRIAADQRDVGPVQRRDGARRGRRRGARGEHLVGQIRGRRVRHGVVGVDDVEPALLGDPRNRVREREQILRLAEQRVRRHLDRHERQAGNAVAPPERRLAADEMHLWPRTASACASSVATTPLPPTEA